MSCSTSAVSVCSSRSVALLKAELLVCSSAVREGSVAESKLPPSDVSNVGCGEMFPESDPHCNK